MSRLGRAQPFAWKLRPALGVVSAAVTIALTGVAATGTVGTLAPSTTVAVTGVAGTGGVGSVGATSTAALTGVAGTGLVGTVTPATTVGLTGVVGTGTVGSVGVTGDRTLAITGVAATGAVGSVGAGTACGTTGVAGTGAGGSVSPATTVALTGVAATAGVGTVVASGGTSTGVTIALTGVAATGAVGNLTVNGGTSLASIYKGDSGLTDDGELFQGYVKSLAVPPGGAIARLGEAAQIGQPILVARASSGVSLMLTIDRDFGLEAQTSTVDLTATASETRVIRKFEGAATADATVLQFQVGDATLLASTWSLEALHVSSDVEGDR